MYMKRIWLEGSLDRRTEKLTEDEIRLLIDRYKAKTLMLATLMLNGDSNYSYNPNTEAKAAYIALRETLLSLIIENHKKGIMSITESDSRIKVGKDSCSEFKEFERLFNDSKSELGTLLWDELLRYSKLHSNCFYANGQKEKEYGPFPVACANWITTYDLKGILADPDLDYLAKGQLFLAHLAANAFKDNTSSVRDSFSYSALGIDGESERIYSRAVDNDRFNSFLFKLSINVVKQGQIEALKYLKELVPGRVNNLYIPSDEKEKRWDHPLIYHYEKGNYNLVRRMLCVYKDSPKIMEKLTYMMLDRTRYNQLLEFMSDDDFTLEVTPEFLSNVALFIPKDEYYACGNGKIDITDELTRRIASAIKNKPGVVGNEEKQRMIDEFIVNNKREIVHYDESGLKSGREAVTQTLGALSTKAGSAVLVKEIPYGGER